MATPFLISILLIASRAISTGDDGASEPPHLELPAIPDSPPLQGLMDIMAKSGCGSFGALLAATPNASDIFLQRLVVGGGGLTVFCPDDKAVGAFELTFRALADSDRIAVLLHHGTAAGYGRAQLAAFDWVAVRTLAANKSQSITVKDDGDTVWLWPSPTSCQGGAVRVLKSVSSEEGPLAVHLVDAVLLPGYLRQKLDGGYFSWLHCCICIPLWVGLSFPAGVIVGVLCGWHGWNMVEKRRIKMMHIMH
jgi:hypothetical protein